MATYQKIDLWSLIGKVDAICVTTNGVVKSNGDAVMGRGCALEALRYAPNAATHLGALLSTHGNVPFILDMIGGGTTALVSFPTKPGVVRISNLMELALRVLPQYRTGQRAPALIPGWKCYSEEPLIEKSARLLVELANTHGWKAVALPMPGVGNGGLSSSWVREILDEILDDRFMVTYA